MKSWLGARILYGVKTWEFMRHESKQIQFTAGFTRLGAPRSLANGTTEFEFGRDRSRGTIMARTVTHWH